VTGITIQPARTRLVTPSPAPIPGVEILVWKVSDAAWWIMTGFGIAASPPSGA